MEIDQICYHHAKKGDDTKPLLVLHFPLLRILARFCAREGFSATINAVFIGAN